MSSKEYAHYDILFKIQDRVLVLYENLEAPNHSKAFLQALQQCVEEYQLPVSKAFSRQKFVLKPYSQNGFAPSFVPEKKLDFNVELVEITKSNVNSAKFPLHDFLEIMGYGLETIVIDNGTELLMTDQTVWVYEVGRFGGIRKVERVR